MLPIMNMTMEQYNESLPRWDGKSPSGRFTHPAEQCEGWNMRKSDNGTIYYTTREKSPKITVWCSGAELDRHMHHLEQIAARRFAFYEEA